MKYYIENISHNGPFLQMASAPLSGSVTVRDINIDRLLAFSQINVVNNEEKEQAEKVEKECPI